MVDKDCVREFLDKRHPGDRVEMLASSVGC
jgi:hypothetical protein